VTKRGKMQRVIMQGLAVMLIVSFLLALVSFAWPTQVSAASHCQCKLRYPDEWCWVDDMLCSCDYYYNWCCNIGQGCWWTSLCKVIAHC